MSDASKHAAWMLGLVGSITLAQWNTILGIACGAAGFLAACLSIYSFFERRRRRTVENQKLEARRLKLEEGRRRHHHLWLVCVLLGLAVQASAQTYGTTATNEPGIYRAANADELGSWHGYTVWHLLGLTVLGWITHANWRRAMPAFRCIQGEGGVGLILWRLLYNPAAVSPPTGSMSETVNKQLIQNTAT